MNKLNQTVATILESNNTGVGKTSLLPETYSFDGNILNVQGLNSVELSENILRALFIKSFNSEFKNSANQQAVLDSYANDYLGTFHQKSANKETTKKNPLANNRKVITASEYLENCYKLGLDVKSLDKVVAVMSTKVTTTTSKADLLKIVEQFRAIFIDKMQAENYQNIAENERADAEKFKGLTDAGFSKIERSGMNISAKIALSESQIGVKAVQDLGFNITDTKVSADVTTLTVYFNEDEVKSI